MDNTPVNSYTLPVIKQKNLPGKIPKRYKYGYIARVNKLPEVLPIPYSKQQKENIGTGQAGRLFFKPHFFPAKLPVLLR